MPNYRRLFILGGTYFFTVNLRNRKSRLLIEQIGLLRASWHEVQKHRNFETIAAVILPDHMHFVWTLPPDDDDFPTRIRLLKSGFTRRLPDSIKTAGRKGERGIWQRRYWEHAIRDDEDLSHCIDYTHFNPVKHGLVKTPDEWQHSTWHRWKAEYEAQSHIPPPDRNTLHFEDK